MAAYNNGERVSERGSGGEGGMRERIERRESRRSAMRKGGQGSEAEKGGGANNQL